MPSQVMCARSHRRARQCVDKKSSGRDMHVDVAETANEYQTI